MLFCDGAKLSFVSTIMGWFGKQAEDVVDSDLKSYYKQQTLQEKPAEPPRTAAEVQPQSATLESLTQPIPEAKLQSRDKTVSQIAMDNCVEYEKAFSNCLLRGTLWERFTSCPTQKTMHDKCVELQTLALQVLNFEQAGDDETKMKIKAQADDLMIRHVPNLTITEANVEAFKSALSSE